MINEQQELKTLAKALEGRGYFKQAETVRGLSLVKVADFAEHIKKFNHLCDVVYRTYENEFETRDGNQGPKNPHGLDNDWYSGGDLKNVGAIRDNLKRVYYTAANTDYSSNPVAYDKQDARSKINFEEKRIEAYLSRVAYTPVTWGTGKSNYKPTYENFKDQFAFKFMNRNRLFWTIAYDRCQTALQGWLTSLKAATDAARAEIQKGIDDKAQATKDEDQMKKDIHGYHKWLINGVIYYRARQSKEDARTVFYVWNSRAEGAPQSPNGPPQSVLDKPRTEEWFKWFKFTSKEALKKIRDDYNKASSFNELEKYAVDDLDDTPADGLKDQPKAKEKKKEEPKKKKKYSGPSMSQLSGGKVHDPTTGNEFRAWVHKNHEDYLGSGIRKLDEKGSWNNAYMRAAWRELVNKQGHKYEPGKKPEESGTQAKLGPAVDQATLKAYLLYNKPLSARDGENGLSKRYGEEWSYTALNAITGEDEIKQRDANLADLTAPGTRSNKFLQGLYAEDTKEGSAQADRLAFHLRREVAKQKAADKAAKDKEKSDAKAKADSDKTKVSSNDFYIIGEDGKDFQYDQVSGLPPTGTLFIRKKDGDFFYLASIDGKPLLATLVRRQNGYGLSSPGLSTLSTKEKARLLGAVNPDKKSLWEAFLSDKAEYRRELAKPSKEGGGFLQDNRETDREDLAKSRRNLFGNPEQTASTERKPANVGMA